MTKNKQKIHIYGYKAIIFQFECSSLKDPDTKLWMWKGWVEISQTNVIVGATKPRLIKYMKKYLRNTPKFKKMS